MPDTYAVVGRLYEGGAFSMWNYFSKRPVSILVNYQRNQIGNPQGFPKVYNRLIRAAFSDPDCRYVWIINDDAHPQAGSLEETQLALEADPTIGIVFPVENWKDGDKVGGFMPWSGKWADHEDLRLFGDRHPLVESMYASFACACVRREVWEKVGEMDETLGLGYGEDLDYGIRTWKAGWRVVNYRKAFFFHERGKTFNRLIEAGVVGHNMPEESAARCKAKWPFLWPNDGRSQDAIDRATLDMLREWMDKVV